MADKDLHEGCFVWVPGRLGRLGIAKVASIDCDRTTVEYFHSISRRDHKVVPTTSVQRVVRISPQTRCYVCDGNGHWHMGRIERLFEGEYEVVFRQGVLPRFYPEKAIYVRCEVPIQDPIETLIFKAHETPYFHDRRFRFVRSLIRQRSACRGMTGLLSSRIALYPHQVEVARRVLQDPIQRYLLSDEVGLGKTIEAGIILRQYLLDDPLGKAIVLVPPLLVDQWHEELEAKFHVSRFSDRLTIAATGQVGTVADGGWGMAVIDEAQHVAGLAFAGDPSAKAQFATFRTLCQSAERLLLLSATPVLNNEREFLAMLHLLDPRVYVLDDLDSFRDRVRRRQDIGHLLLSLQEGTPGFLLQDTAQRLREVFPKDESLGQLTRGLETAIVSFAGGGPECDRAVRAIRVHISETYRLHRRMLRNRRGSVQIEAMLGRAGGDRDTPRTLEYDIDERSPRVHELLEEWRESAISRVGWDIEHNNLLFNKYCNIFIVFLTAAGAWLELLDCVVALRLGRRTSDGLGEDFTSEELDVLRSTDLFPGEKVILEEIRDLLHGPAETGDRLDHLVAALKNVKRGTATGSPPKCVVFCSSTRACRELLARLRTCFGEDAVEGYYRDLPRPAVERSLARFRIQRGCFVLVCDRGGEEGRNLQFAERVIHFDLPFSPNRMEQRIGRLDRIGRDRLVKSIIFVGPVCQNSLFEAWYQLLDQGFRVFDSSIASLQFFVDEHLASLYRAMFSLGAQGLREQIEIVRSGIAAERGKIEEQDALDAIDALDDQAVSCFETLETLERSHDSLEQDFHCWVGEALMFRRNPSFFRTDGWILYGPDVNRFGRSRTLVPSDWIKHRLAGLLNQPGTFDRQKAVRDSGLTLFRVGEAFVDAMASYIQWDDRGQAFALWRHERSWDPKDGAEWTGFRFNYVVTTDLAPAKEVLKNNQMPVSALRSLRRRAEALLPPRIEVVFLDTDCRVVVDPKVVSILDRPYVSGKDGGNDYNLANERLSTLDHLIDPGRWPVLCKDARAASADEVLSRGDPNLRELCETLASNAERELGSRLIQLRLRLAREQDESGAGASVTRRDLEIEEALGRALVEGIRSPELRLDSVGFIVIAGRPSRSAGSKGA